MKTQQFIKQANEETAGLSRDLDNVIDEYLTNSEMPKDQRIVNVGRALNAIHVAWVANLGAELESRHKHLSGTVGREGTRTVPAFDKPAKEFNL